MNGRPIELFLCVFGGIALAACRTDKGPTPTVIAAAKPSTTAQPSTTARPSASVASARPTLPSANLALHVVATSARGLELAVLDNAALAYADPSHDALLLDQHRIRSVPGVFAGVEVPEDWSFGPVQGRWPDLVILTVAKRGYRGYAKEAKVFRKTGARWAPLPGEVGHDEVIDVVGQSLLVQSDDGLRFFDAGGHEQKLAVQKSVDGDVFNVLGASRDAKGRIFVSGFIHNPPPEDAGRLTLSLSSGGGVDYGVAIIQRWESGATAPVIDRMSDPNRAQVDALSGAGVYSSGESTFAVFGRSHTIARFYDGTWSLEPLPIDPACSGVRDFSLAKDGTAFFGTSGGTGESAIFRRKVDGRYDQITLPQDLDATDLYAESADAVWIVADSPTKGPASTLYFTQPLGPAVTIP